MAFGNRLINTNAGGGSGLFLAVGDGTYNAAYSTDGVTWTGVTDTGISSLNYGYGVSSFENNYWIVGYDGTNHKLFHSTDAINWTERTNPQPPTPNATLVNVFCDGTRLYVIGYRTYYTTDLTASGGWTEITNSDFTNYGEAMTYTGQNWILTGRGTPVIKYSTNGTNFTDVTTPRILFDAIGVSSNGAGVVVAVGYDGSRVASSTNHGVTWSNITTSGSVGYGSYWDGTNFHADVQGGSYYRSPDGISFTSYTKPLSNRIEEMASNGSTLVAVGGGTNTITYSTNGGTSWNPLGTSIFTTGRGITCNVDPNITRP